MSLSHEGHLNISVCPVVVGQRGADVRARPMPDTLVGQFLLDGQNDSSTIFLREVDLVEVDILGVTALDLGGLGLGLLFAFAGLLGGLLSLH